MKPAPECGPRDYLYSLALHGIKLGLDNIRLLLDADGNPHLRYPCVHVGGTNGKGSVVAFLQSMFRQAGYRVGRFTSPHILDVTERFQVDGVPMPNSILEETVEHFRIVANDMEPPPTFFEMNTAIAFHRFAEAGVDVALIEVGMGGRLDSTNVIAPAATAVTNIDLEHTAYLGDTVEKIAEEKAGIFKAGVPAVIGETGESALRVLLERAAAVGAPVRRLWQDFHFTLTGGLWDARFRYESEGMRVGATPLGLTGPHQGENAALAVALAESLRMQFPRLNEKAIQDGLAAARWPCRLERVLDDPPVIQDVAHNPAGAVRIAQAIRDAVTILAVASDKDARGMIRALAPCTHRFILTQFEGKRALPLDRLEAAAAGVEYHAVPNLDEAIALGYSIASNAHPLLITGSIFAAAEARRILMDTYGAPPPQF